VNEHTDKSAVRWTEDRVERLMLKIFGDPPHLKPTEPPPRLVRHRWSNWFLVATCASILLLLAPVLSMWRDAELRLAEQRTQEAAEEMVVAEASTSDEAISSDESADEISSDESSESDSDSESSEASSS